MLTGRLQNPERDREHEGESTDAVASRPKTPAEGLLSLQRTAGNRAVAEMIGNSGNAVLARRPDPAAARAAREDRRNAARHVRTRARRLRGPAQELVRWALELDTEVMTGAIGAPLGVAERGAKAKTLCMIADALERRIRRAPIDDDGLPQLEGITWDRDSPLAGVLGDIPPFGNHDLWIGIAEDPARGMPERRDDDDGPTPSGERDVPVPVPSVPGRSVRDAAEFAAPDRPQQGWEEGAATGLQITADTIGELAGGAIGALGAGITSVAGAVAQNILFFAMLDQAFRAERLASIKYGARLGLRTVDEWGSNYMSPPIPSRIGRDVLERRVRRVFAHDWAAQIASTPQMSHRPRGDRAEDAMREGVHTVANQASVVLMKADEWLEQWLAQHRADRPLTERELARIRGPLLQEFAERTLERIERQR